MDACVKHWQNYDGLWTQMNNIKEVFVEPRDRNALAKVAQEYRNRVNAQGSLGAVLMAVCRYSHKNTYSIFNKHFSFQGFFQAIKY